MAGERPSDSPIRPECWEEFCLDYAALWDQLVSLRVSIYLLRELSEFPIRAFLSSDDQWFLTVVGRSLYESVVLGVTKLVTDKGGDLLTIRGWRNRVRAMLSPDRVEEYDSRLGETKLQREVEALAERARDFRDGQVAHLRLDDVREGAANSLRLTELERLVKDTERLFEPLLFGASASFMPPCYDPEVRVANPVRATDVERILNYLASESFAMNEPETHPKSWARRRAEMTPGQLAEFNKWRERIGKPQA